MFPRLIHIYGPLWIQSYGVMIALGFLVFLYCTYGHSVRKRLISGDAYLHAVFLGLVAGIIGGRILFVITDFATFDGDWVQIFYPWVGGFSVLGSIVGVLAIVPLYLRWHTNQVLTVFDLAAAYAPLMQSIARIGCFLAGCCYGAPIQTDLCCSVLFTNPEGVAPLGVALHPSQIYSSLALLSIFLFLWVLIKYKAVRPGQVLFTYLILEGIERFSIDFFRGDRGDLIYMLSQAQLISLGLLGVGILGLLFVTFVYKRPAQYLK